MNNQSQKSQAAIPESFGLQAMINYMKFTKKITSLMEYSNIEILKDANILIFLNIRMIIRNIKNKKSIIQQSKMAGNILSLFQIGLLKQIKDKQNEYFGLTNETQLIITQKYLSKISENNKQLITFIRQFIKNSNDLYLMSDLIKLQFFLRQKILQIFQQLSEKSIQQIISYHQTQCLILDYLISILQLNAFLVSINNQWKLFGYKSKIQMTLECPITFNHKVVQNIFQKIKQLNLI